VTGICLLIIIALSRIVTYCDNVLDPSTVVLVELSFAGRFSAVADSFLYVIQC